MRAACTLVLILGACASDSGGGLEDGRYAGAITASGCMQGKQLSINVVGGRASLAGCSTNTKTNDGFDYACTANGGEQKYLCIQQSTVLQSTDVVHASIVGANTLSGTIMRTETLYAPPNCTVMSQCVDNGTFELVLQ